MIFLSIALFSTATGAVAGFKFEDSQQKRSKHDEIGCWPRTNKKRRQEWRPWQILFTKTENYNIYKAVSFIF